MAGLMVWCQNHWKATLLVTVGMMCLVTLLLLFPWGQVFQRQNKVGTTPPTTVEAPPSVPFTGNPLGNGSTTNTEVINVTNRTVREVVMKTNETTVLIPTNSGSTAIPTFSVNISGTNAVSVQNGGQFIVGGIVNVEMPGGRLLQANQPDSLYVPVAIGQKKVTIPHGKSALIMPQGLKVDYEPKLPSLSMKLDGLLPHEAGNNPRPRQVTIHNSGEQVEVVLDWIQ